MSWPNSPLCLNMNAPMRTALSPQLALTVKGWSRSRHLLSTTYLLPTVLPTENLLEDSFSILFEHVLMNETLYIANSFGIFTKLWI